jgi:hypothetical protein
MPNPLFFIETQSEPSLIQRSVAVSTRWCGTSGELEEAESAQLLLIKKYHDVRSNTFMGRELSQPWRTAMAWSLWATDHIFKEKVPCIFLDFEPSPYFLPK